MIDTTKLDRILPLVEKPGRYIGRELGSVKKSTELPIRFLFAFPDVYEVFRAFHFNRRFLLYNDPWDKRKKKSCNFNER